MAEQQKRKPSPAPTITMAGQQQQFYANMPLESPLFLPIMPVSCSLVAGRAVLAWSTLASDSLTLLGHLVRQVDPSPTTGLQHLIPPLFGNQQGRQAMGNHAGAGVGGMPAGALPGQMPSPVRARLIATILIA
jgi:hypothetical protein